MLRVYAYAALLVTPFVGAVPVVNVRLSQPAVPLPEVSAEIATLEVSRDNAEATGLNLVDAAFGGAAMDASGASRQCSPAPVRQAHDSPLPCCRRLSARASGCACSRLGQ